MEKHENTLGWQPAYRFFIFDTFVNYGLGILFIFFYKQAESFISEADLLPDYFWIGMGLGFLLFGFWQTYVLVTNSFVPKNRMISCILSWSCFVALTFALLFMGFSLKPLPGILIWTANLYMLFLGIIYLISWYKSTHQ